MQHFWILTGGLVTALLLGSDRPGKAVKPNGPDGPDGKGLFLQNCARCHGETGNGKGITELDRPARSFLQGGFSYGNTPSAVERTITNGIPGTPMPAFDSSLTRPERQAVAAYVISLGPEGVSVDPSETILVVEDRPLVVRGFLPPISGEDQQHPRGLLLGTLEGLSFEYSADDVRLLGVRAGEFVERRDWAGRGGDPLNPLGKVVYLMESGAPPPMFYRLDEQQTHKGTLDRLLPLHARLRSTWIQHERVGLSYRLEDEKGLRVEMNEEVRSIRTSVASGFQRILRRTNEQREQDLLLALDSLSAGDKIVARSPVDSDSGKRGQESLLVRRENGRMDFFHVLALDTEKATSNRASLVLRPLAGGQQHLNAELRFDDAAPIAITTISGTNFAPEAFGTLCQELAR